MADELKTTEPAPIELAIGTRNGSPQSPEPSIKVVNLAERRARKLHCMGDDAGFMSCPVCQGEDLAVVCRGITGRPFVAALVCVGECDGATEIMEGVHQ